MPGFSSFLLISKETFRSSAKFRTRTPESLHDAPSLETPLSLGRAFGRGRRFAFVGKLTNHANAGAERIE